MPRYARRGATVMLSGAPYPNETLQVKAPDDFEISSIQWMKVVGGKEVAITGETGSTYMVKPEDLGVEIYPVISVTPTSARKKVVAKPAPPIVKTSPTIDVVAGGDFNFVSATFDGADVSVVTEWFVDGVSVGSSKPDAVEQGQLVKVVQTGKNAIGEVKAESPLTYVFGDIQARAVMTGVEIVPFTDFLKIGEALDNEAGTDYSDLANQSIRQLSDRYKKDSVPKVLYWPKGEFTASMLARPGVGIIGAGSDNTFFYHEEAPIFRAVVGVPEVDSGMSERDFSAPSGRIKDVRLCGYTADVSSQSRKVAGKAHYFENVVDLIAIDVSSYASKHGFEFHNSTRIGMTSCRALYAQVGFIFDMPGVESLEPVILQSCKAISNTKGYLFYRTGNVIPTGSALIDCVAENGSTGLVDSGLKGLAISGGSYSKNTAFGIFSGYDNDLNLARPIGPAGGVLSNVTISENGSDLFGGGGLQFGLRPDETSADTFYIDGCHISSNKKSGIWAVGDAYYPTHEGVPPANLNISGGTNISSNGGPGLSIHHRSFKMKSLVIDSSVVVDGNCNLPASNELPDALSIGVGVGTLDVRCKISDKKQTPTQTVGVAMRGWRPIDNVHLLPDLTEHPVVGGFLFNGVASAMDYAPIRAANYAPVKKQTTNYFINPVLKANALPVISGGQGAVATYNGMDIPIGGKTSALKITRTAGATLNVDFSSLIAWSSMPKSRRYTFKIFMRVSKGGVVLQGWTWRNMVFRNDSNALTRMDPGQWIKVIVPFYLDTSNDGKLNLVYTSDKQADGDEVVEFSGGMVFEGGVDINYIDGTWTGTQDQSPSVSIYNYE